MKARSSQDTAGSSSVRNRVPDVFLPLFLPFQKSLEAPATEGRRSHCCCRGWLKCLTSSLIIFIKLEQQSSLNGWESFLSFLKWMIQMEIKGGKYIQKTCQPNFAVSCSNS